jgi:hypothetical protein
VAGIVPAWVHNLGKAGDELFHRAASALDRTARLQPCPLHRNTTHKRQRQHQRHMR